MISKLRYLLLDRVYCTEKVFVQIFIKTPPRVEPIRSLFIIDNMLSVL